MELNTDTLYDYLAVQLHTFVRQLDYSGNLLNTYTTRSDLNTEFENQIDYIPLLQKRSTVPTLYVINNLLTYAVIYLEDFICILGPCGVCSDCKKKLSIPDCTIPEDIIPKLYHTDSGQILGCSLYLYNLFHKDSIDLLTCLNENCEGSHVSDSAYKKVTKSLFYHEEYGDSHYSYEDEKREMLCIERGDIAGLKKFWKQSNSGNLGKMSQDIWQNVKYLCVINISLSSRAAIRGGLPCELAYSLRDSYCQQIDELIEKDAAKLEGIIRNIQLSFTQLVAQQRQKNVAHDSNIQPMISRATDYIFSHLHGKLTVTDVAEHLMIHPNYLNRLFKESLGVTVHDYIQREKVNLICNMLTYSNYSYIDIANYFGFSSQSHLGSVFKKHIGMTPKAYRQIYHKY